MQLFALVKRNFFCPPERNLFSGNGLVANGEYLLRSDGIPGWRSARNSNTVAVQEKARSKRNRYRGNCHLINSNLRFAPRIGPSLFRRGPAFGPRNAQEFGVVHSQVGRGNETDYSKCRCTSHARQRAGILPFRCRATNRIIKCAADAILRSKARSLARRHRR